MTEQQVWTPEPLTPGERATINDIVGFGVCYMSQATLHEFKRRLDDWRVASGQLWAETDPSTLQRLYGVSIQVQGGAPDGLVAGPAFANHRHGVIPLDKLLPAVR